MDMIQIINNKPVLDTSTLNKILDFEKKLKEIKEAKEELNALLLAEMESKSIIKIESDDLLINYIAPSDRETFDSKTFRAEHPDMYDSYIKMSPVKASVRVKIK